MLAWASCVTAGPMHGAALRFTMGLSCVTMGPMQLRYGVAQLRYNGRGLRNVFDKCSKSEGGGCGRRGGTWQYWWPVNDGAVDTAFVFFMIAEYLPAPGSLPPLPHLLLTRLSLRSLRNWRKTGMTSFLIFSFLGHQPHFVTPSLALFSIR